MKDYQTLATTAEMNSSTWLLFDLSLDYAEGVETGRVALPAQSPGSVRFEF